MTKIFPHGGRFYFDCPGCADVHCVDAGWTFNNDLEKPTFSPSILVTGGSENIRCHSFVKDGQIQFLADSTHELAGRTTELPEFNSQHLF